MEAKHFPQQPLSMQSFFDLTSRLLTTLPRLLYKRKKVSCILIHAETSSPTLSKSGKHEFSITLHATTDTEEAITIDPFLTLLHQQMRGFDGQGFSFEDSKGEFATLPTIHVNYMPKNVVVPASTIEIPGKGSEHPFTITHDLDYSWSQGDSRESWHQQLVEQLLNKTAGFDIDQIYKIGLGNHWNAVRWWRLGSKADVFRDRKQLSVHAVGEKLPLILMNSVCIEVID